MKTIEQRLNDYMNKEQEQRKERQRSGKWNPSSFGQCFRRQYWNRKDEPVSNPPDNRSLRVMKMGVIMHEFLQDIIKKQTKMDYICEVLVETEDCCGYADIVFDDEVVDIKTMHSRGFWRMGKDDFEFEVDKNDHILQATFYAMILDKPRVRICYVSRDDLSIEEFTVDVKGHWIRALDGEMTKLNEIWNKDKLPKAEPRLYINKDGVSKECTYCNWRDKCGEIEKGSPALTQEQKDQVDSVTEGYARIMGISDKGV